MDATSNGFIMDYSLHRVAKYLRLLGYNTVCDCRIRHRELITKSERENLALITASPALIAQVEAHNRAVRRGKESNAPRRPNVVAYNSDGESVYSDGDDEIGESEIVVYDVSQELRESFFPTMVNIIRRARICYDADRVFSRCVTCNEVLVHVLKESVKGDVHEKVYSIYESFTRCPRCQKVFWGVDGPNVYNYTSFRTIQHLQRLCQEAGAVEIKSSNVASLSSFRSFPMAIRALIFSFLSDEDLTIVEDVFPLMKELFESQRLRNRIPKTKA